MKSKIVKFSLLTILFALFCIACILQFIDFIALVKYGAEIEGKGYNKLYMTYPEFALNLKIPYFFYFLFSTMLLYTTITAFLGYKVVSQALSMYKEKYADKFTARKQKRAQAKAERAEEAKQAKIQALEAELQELKND